MLCGTVCLTTVKASRCRGAWCNGWDDREAEESTVEHGRVGCESIKVLCDPDALIKADELPRELTNTSTCDSERVRRSLRSSNISNSSAGVASGAGTESRSLQASEVATPRSRSDNFQEDWQAVCGYSESPATLTTYGGSEDYAFKRAIELGQKDMVSLLLQAGADKDDRSYDGESAEELAHRLNKDGHLDPIIQVLNMHIRRPSFRRHTGSSIRSRP
eukprot:TRINITY_DN33062_c0_g1_i1.p1 TRINITY_DN33062_c0_g1~~TRINITY_DN33062_c0_g1_i1.p1  ORF type:complete len:218 (+),score=32.66 TRINITY_DN33062_c0_g1_i1:139-792(+)